MLNTKYPPCRWAGKIRYTKRSLFLLILLILGFIYRINGLEKNYSFWSDEENVAVFSRAILETGKPVLENGFTTKIFQWALYWTTAASMKVFGISEFSARLPILIFGTLTIFSVFLLGRKLFSEKVGLLAAFFTAFLDIEILWSRQLRPYQVFQFFWLLGSFFSFKFLEDKNKKNLVWVVLCGLLAIIFHPLGSVFFVFQLIFYLFLWLRDPKHKHLAWGIGFFLLTGAIFLRVVPSIFNLLKRFGQFNNFFYYRVFLTHNYLPLVLFCILGFYFLLRKKKKKEVVFFALVLGLQTLAVSFLAPQPFTRYFYPVFVFIILLASYGILEISGRKSNILILVVILFLWKSDKLSLFPKKIYSLNADMQEVPEIDWKKIYGFVGQKFEENPKAVLMTNWSDLPVWYLGEGRLNYLVYNAIAEKDSFSGAQIINSLDEFINLQRTEKKGFFVLDSWDNLVPDGIREYCQNNLKLEFEIDRIYPVQPRYWTVWVYSWGY